MHIQVIFTPIMWYNYPIKKNNLSEAENTMTNNNTDKDKTLKQREQIPNEYKWDIEAMYPDETAWDRDVADSIKAAEDFKRFQGRVTESADTLYEALSEKDVIWKKLDHG